MPLTVLTTFGGSLILLGSWYLIGARMRASEAGSSRQISLMRQFFLYIGIFFLCMFVPHLWLGIDQGKFPFYMALGYTVGHIFLYISLLYLALLFFSMVPRLTSKTHWAAGFCIAANVVITALTATTMLFGTRPSYDFAHNITLFNAKPVVGVSIALFSLTVIAPTAILMIANGIRNPQARVRSFLLGSGLFILLTGGPLHDTARTAAVYMIADSVTILGLIIVASGLLYRFEERLIASREPAARVPLHR